MAIFHFYKLNKHKEFNYMPLFYDKDKEEFNERVRRIEEEMGKKNSSNEFRTSIRKGTMRDNLQISKRPNRASSLRLISIIIILLAAAYLIIFR